jgi:hypothetical protein
MNEINAVNEMYALCTFSKWYYIDNMFRLTLVISRASIAKKKYNLYQDQPKHVAYVI